MPEERLTPPGFSTGPQQQQAFIFEPPQQQLFAQYSSEEILKYLHLAAPAPASVSVLAEEETSPYSILRRNSDENNELEKLNRAMLSSLLGDSTECKFRFIVFVNFQSRPCANSLGETQMRCCSL